MLPKIAHLNSLHRRGGRWTLLLLAGAMLAVPTWFVEAQDQNSGSPRGLGVSFEVSQAAPGIGIPVPVKHIQYTENHPEFFAGGGALPAGAPAGARLGPGMLAAATPRFLPPKVEYLPQLSAKSLKILSELDKLTTFDFTDESLDGVRDTIMERHGFDIIIEKARLEEESVASDATDITLKVSEIPLRSALKLLVRIKNLSYIIEDDVLKITTNEVARAQRMTRTYPVRDLVGNDVEEFRFLMEAIKQGVVPNSWTEVGSHPAAMGMMPGLGARPQGATGGPRGGVANNNASAGPCTISIVPASGSLVVYQSWDGHEEVAKLLRALRQAKSDSQEKLRE